MIPGSERPSQRRSWIRILAVAGSVVVAYLVMSVGPSLLKLFVAPATLRRSRMAVLETAEATYIATLGVAVLGVFLLGGVVLRARRRRRRMPAIVTRLLLLSAAVLLGAGLAEAGATVLRALTADGVPLAVPRAARLPELAMPGPGGRGKEVRIVVVGESSAEGVPYQGRLSIGEVVAWRLQQALPDRRVSVDVQARSGLTLQAMHRLLSGLTERPDVVIVYAGHNEFSGRHNWSDGRPYYVDQVPSQFERIGPLFARFSAVCAGIEEAVRLLRVQEPPPPWVTRRVVDVPVYTPEEYARLRSDFHERLRDIAVFCRRVGALAVLVLPCGNDAGFEPNRSVLPVASDRAGREAFAHDFLDATAVAAVAPERGVAVFRRLVADQPGFAASHYKLARLLERGGSRDEAYQHFVAARDLDGLPMRCPSDFQQAYRDVARAEGAKLVDGQALFRALSSSGQLDHTLFGDPMHPTLRGHLALAQAVLDRLREWPGLGWKADDPPLTLDPAACVSHFHMDSPSWGGACALSAEVWRKVAYVTYDSTERVSQARRYEEASRALYAGRRREEAGLPGLDLAPLVPAEPVRTRSATASPQPPP